MALTRSASGPGGLSLNTTSANSLFGSTAATPVSGGLFGGAAKPATGGLFGNSAATTTTTAPSGGLFGSAAAATTSAPQTGGLFGSAATPAASQTQQSGSLFGSASISTSQPQQSGGLFGASAATSQPAQTGGLFGGATSQPQQTGGMFGAQQNTTQGAASGGLFGSSNQQTGGLFGSTASTTQPTQSGGLFGGLNTQNKPATGGLFAAAQPQQQQAQAGRLFGGSVAGGGLQLGQSTNTQQTTPGVRIDISNIRNTTRFNELHDDLQKQIEMMDKVIQGCQQQCHEITAILPSHGDQLTYIPENVEFLQRKSIGVESALETDAESLDLVGGLVKKDLQDASMSFRAIDVLNLPQQYQQHTRTFFNQSNNQGPANGAGNSDIVTFYSQAADEINGTITTYRQRIGEIETHLRSVEAATMQQALALGYNDVGDQEDEMREVALVLREFETGILGVAGKVGKAREGLQKLQLGAFEDLGKDGASRLDGNRKRTGIY